jgi:ketosteroid isomerase-like protein
MPSSPREVAEQVRRMVAGEGVVFADLFATDGVLAYPFAPPGQPRELGGRDAIRDYHSRAAGEGRQLLVMDGVDMTVRDTDDPEVVVVEITHFGWSRAQGAPYRFSAIGVVRVRDGKIVRYEDYMDPIARARLFGGTEDLIAHLNTVG